MGGTVKVNWCKYIAMAVLLLLLMMMFYDHRVSGTSYIKLFRGDAREKTCLGMFTMFTVTSLVLYTTTDECCPLTLKTTLNDNGPIQSYKFTERSIYY